MKNKRVALVTGATGGLGTAMCKKLCDDGFHVVANYRNRQKADDWYAAMRTDGYDIDMFEGDVCDFESVKRMILEIETKIGGIDVLVNNAGITRDGRLAKMSLDDWNAVIHTNLNSVLTVHVT